VVKIKCGGDQSLAIAKVGMHKWRDVKGGEEEKWRRRKDRGKRMEEDKGRRRKDRWKRMEEDKGWRKIRREGERREEVEVVEVVEVVVEVVASTKIMSFHPPSSFPRDLESWKLLPVIATTLPRHVTELYFAGA
jgi:hypothetical protein